MQKIIHSHLVINKTHGGIIYWTLAICYARSFKFLEGDTHDICIYWTGCLTSLCFVPQSQTHQTLPADFTEGQIHQDCTAAAFIARRSPPPFVQSQHLIHKVHGTNNIKFSRQEQFAPVVVRRQNTEGPEMAERRRKMKFSDRRSAEKAPQRRTSCCSSIRKCCGCFDMKTRTKDIRPLLLE